MTRGGGHKNVLATQQAGFTDERSYIRIDGKQFLFGDDLAQLRRRVFERDAYLCTGEVDGERCNRLVAWDGLNAGHMHHVRERGKGGDDSMSNCVTLCGSPNGCHAKLHPRPRLRWIRETA